MSNQRKLKPQNPVSAMVAELDGLHIPGGCGHCDAYQTVTAHRHGPDIHAITVHHDADCPWLAAQRSRR